MKMRKTGWAALVALLVSFVAEQASALRPRGGARQAPAASARFRGGGNAAEIPARFLGGLVFLPAAVNQSQPSLFLLDSTAPASTIDPDRRAELGISNLQPAVLNLSGVDLTLASLGELAKKDFAARVGRAYEGTLGNDFLACVVLEINYARQTVRLYDPASYQYAGRSKGMHVSFIDGLPALQAKMSVSGNKTVEGDFVIDTALDASLLISQAFARSHKLHPRKPIPGSFSVGEGADRAELARVSGFDLGLFSIPQSIGVFPQSDTLADRDRRLAGEIGAKMLARFIVTFDYPHQQIFLDASTNFRADEVEDMSGLVIQASRPGLKRFEVTEVWPHTPGADAGIRPGDIIEGINDEAAADMSLAEIRALFRQPAGRYKILIGRGTETVTVNVRMRHLLD
jgi:PDZ domain